MTVVADRTTTTKTRILEACNQLFIERGVSNVSMEDVADAAQVGRATIYRHYADREALEHAAVRHHSQGTAARMRAAIEAHQEFVDRIGALGAVMARIATETRLDTRRRDIHDHYLAELFVAGIDGIVGDLVDFVEPLVVDAIANGELEGDDLDVRSYADWVARMLIGILLVPGSAVADLRDPAQAAAHIRTNLLAGRRRSGDTS